MKEKYSVLIALMGMEIGGAETHVLELSKALVRMGIKVYVASNGGIYEKELADNNIIHFKLPLNNKRPQSLIKSYNGLKRIIRENKIGLVHAHARIPALLCGMLQKKMKFHFVTSAHFNFNTDFPFNILTHWGEKTIAVSDDIKKYLMGNYKINEENIVITVNGISTETFGVNEDYSDIIKEFNLDVNKKRIVHVCRLIKANDLATRKLLDCAEGIYSKNPNIEILIVGDGADFEYLKKRADDINEKVGQVFIYLTGPRTDVNKFIASCTVFVGVSRAALEAMVAERIVVMAGPQGYVGIYDQSKEEIALSTNFCFRDTEMPTAKKMEQDILQVLNMDEGERKRLGVYGAGIVRKHYSVERMALDTKAVYDCVLEQPVRKIDVMISGYYGSRNSGDDALLKAIVDQLKAEKPNINIVALSRRPDETRINFNVSSIFWLDFVSIMRAMKDTRLLIMGGGNLMQDGTSQRNLFYYLQIIGAAKHYGAKVMLYANGIGPLNHEKSKVLVTKYLNEAVDYITLREEQSYNELQKMGVVNPPMKVTADAAFGLEFSEKFEYEEDYFVVSVRKWSMVEPQFEQKIADICDYVKEKYHLQALFVSMQDKYDSEISKRVCAKMKNKGVFLRESYSLSEMMGIVKGSRFALGMRLHTVIYAAKAGVPIIGLVYDPKVQHIMEYIEQPFYVPVTDVDYERVISYVDEIMANQNGISEKLSQISQKLKKKNMENTGIAVELIQSSV